MNVWKVSSLQPKVGGVLILSILCGVFLGLGWFQPTTADAEILRTGSNAAIAVSPRNDTAAQVIMQRFQVTSESGGTDDGKVVLNSLTLDDAAATAQYSAVRAYLSTTAATTLPADAVRIGTTSGIWTGVTATTITLSPSATVSTGTPNYIYVVYDMLAGQAPNTAQSRVTALGVVGPDTADLTGLPFLSNSITLASGGAKAAIVNCYDCHGDSTRPTMDGPRSASTGSFIGSHSKHVGTMTYACTHCHTDNTSTGHRNNNINMSNPIFSGAGAYSKAVGPSYSFPQSSNPTMGTCSSISCHSSGQSADGSSATPVYAPTPPTWGGTAACGSCHATSAMATGGHTKHLTTDTNCGSCHTDASLASYNSTNHVNQLIDVATALSYTGSGAPGNGYATCTTASCHDNGKGLAVASPMWGTSAAACSACHAAAPATDSHAKHLSGTLYKTPACADCHAGTTQGVTAGTSHLDGNIDVSVGNYPANKTKGSALANCSTAACHSSGQSVDGLSATPASYATVTWGGTAACGSCHATSAMATGGHTKHLTADTNCGNCHTGAALASYNSTSHVNQLVDVTTALSYTGSGAPGNGYATCTTASCHDNGKGLAVASPMWGTSAAACSACHAAAPATDSHTTHLSVSGIACAICHAGTTQGVTAGAGHLDGNIDISVGSYPANKTKGSALGTCATACHGSGTPTWGGNTATLSCEKCHGSATTDPFRDTAGNTLATDAQVGAHAIHLLGANNYSNPIACTECHTVPASPGDAGHYETALPAENVFGSLAKTGGLNPSYTAPSCSVTYCHGNAMPKGSTGGTAKTPSWTDTGYLSGTPSLAGDCGKCHEAPPLSVTPHTASMTIADCAACHQHFSATGALIAAQKGLHVNGIVEATGGSCNSCHDYDVDPATQDWGKSPKAVEGWGAHAVHIKHLTLVSGVTLSATGDNFNTPNFNAVCGVCHTRNSADHAMGGTPNTRTINFGGVTDYQFSTSATMTYSGLTGMSSASNPKTCSNMSCHFQTTPVWQGY